LTGSSDFRSWGEDRRAPGDRQGVEVQVNHDEEVANRIDPVSCAAAREGNCEALTGERQPLMQIDVEV
jgi:hypothetical protein